MKLNELSVDLQVANVGCERQYGRGLNFALSLSATGLSEDACVAPRDLSR